jgi:hypothetical protein
VTKERRRKWTGLAVALTVTFTVCDAQQVGLSPSAIFLLASKNYFALRMMRPEQKAPPILAPMRVSNQAFASRKQAAGIPRQFNGLHFFRYALISQNCGLDALISQPNSAEKTRGPPRLGPPFLC